METEKNDIIECEIEDMGVYGEGISHVGGQTVFIPGALIGERVAARIVLAKPTFAHAVLIKRLTVSPHRVEPLCPHFKQCGGCSLQHLDYEGQLALKREIVSGALKKYARVEITVDEVVPSEPFFYRNKLSLPVRSGKRGTESGLFMKRSHNIVPIKQCPIQKPITFRAASSAFDFAIEQGLVGYDENSGRGDLRHIAVRSLSGEVCLTFVLTAQNKGFERALKAAAEESGRENLSVFVNYNAEKNNVILGNSTKLIYGSTSANLGGLTVDTHPQAFFQVNDGIRDKLYAAVAKNIDGGNVIDAYSGAGVMSAMLAQKAESVIGIEISRAATESANALKERLSAKSLSFICGDCGKELQGALKAMGEGVTVVLDPPKSGCDESVINAIINAKAKKIIYVSCNPATLARDIAKLVGGYDLVSVTPFDMFPQTTSVETLAVLSRK